MNTLQHKRFTKRSVAFTAGVTLAIIGMLMFFGLAVSLAGSAAAPGLLPASTKWKVISGVALVAAGFVVMTLGSQSLAIDMRSDDSLEHTDPWHELANDAQSEAVTSSDTKTAHCHEAPADICCRLCHAENDAEAKFCDQCGERLVFTA